MRPWRLALAACALVVCWLPSACSLLIPIDEDRYLGSGGTPQAPDGETPEASGGAPVDGIGGMATGGAQMVTAGGAGGTGGRLVEATGGFVADPIPPAHHYRLDQSQGDVAVDSGTGDEAITGLLSSSGTSWVEEAGRRGLELSSTGHIDMGATLADQVPFTLAIWLRPATTETRVILDKQFNDGFQLRLHNEGVPEFRVGAATESVSIAGAQALPIEQWTHVAVTYAVGVPTQDVDTVTLYLDGVKETDGQISDQGPTNTETRFRVGEPAANTAFPGFLGVVSDFRVYHRALTSTEIEEIANL